MNTANTKCILAIIINFISFFLQLWDKDIVKWDDHIAEALVDLGPHFRKAYKSRNVVKLFQDPALLAKKKEIEKAEVSFISEFFALPFHSKPFMNSGHVIHLVDGDATAVSTVCSASSVIRCRQDTDGQREDSRGTVAA